MSLATLQLIENVRPHPNADRLDLVNILGYQCVTEKGLYQDGDQVIYIKTDTLLPEAEWSEGYRKYSPKRVKAVKLRGEWSEGIIVPTYAINHILPELLVLGEDYAEILGVTKWEAPAPQDLNAKRSTLPYDIGKTDETRWEEKVGKLPLDEIVDITFKVDGSSASYYYHLGDKQFGVLSRTQELKPECSNNYTNAATKLFIEEKLKTFCEKVGKSLVIRGEVYGNGIQGSANNPHSKLPLGWAMFSVYDIEERRYYRKGEPFYFVNVARELALPHVAIVEENVALTMDLILKYSSGINKIDGKPFEGVVVNHSKGSFKIINKDYDASK